MGLDDVQISKADPDTIKPSTSATCSVEPNEAGWNKENVAVTLNAADNQGESGVEKITYSASGAQSIAQTDAPVIRLRSPSPKRARPPSPTTPPTKPEA